MEVVDNNKSKISEEAGQALVRGRKPDMIVEFNSIERPEEPPYLIKYYKIGGDVVSEETWRGDTVFFLEMEEYLNYSREEAMEDVLDSLVSIERERGGGDDIEVSIREGYTPKGFDFPIKIPRS